MEQNVKKRNAHNIYYGRDQVTGKSRHISEVVSGAKCGCSCFACGEPLEARKGSVRRHHFAHISNYECMYASEVAIYKAVADILGDSRCFRLPPITLSFPAWNHEEQLKETRKVDLEDVSFSCKPLQYPPALFITVSGKKLRILLEFESYYSQDDIHIFENEAREGEYSSLLCHFPNVDNETFFMPEHLKSVLATGIKEQVWIRSALTDRWQKRLYSKAVKRVEQDGGYECPIHIRKYRGRYCAILTDCTHCNFNIAESLGCLCLAESGIQSHKDYFKDPSILQSKIEQLRQHNEQIIEQQEKKEEQQEEQRKRPYSTTPPAILPPAIPDVYSHWPADPSGRRAILPPAIPDVYSRRMLQCKYCGQRKPTDEFAAYGGRADENICRICARKMT